MAYKGFLHAIVVSETKRRNFINNKKVQSIDRYNDEHV